MHGRPLFEVTVGPLIGEARQRLQVGDDVGSHVRHEGAGEAEEKRRLSRNRRRTGDARCECQLARETLLPVEAATGKALADTRHREQGTCLVAS